MRSRKQTSPAQNLDEVYKTFSLMPLIEPDEFHAFYRGQVNEVRGGDKVGLMARKFHQSFDGSFYKAFLMGHAGVGKSTEMTRLSLDVADKFRVVRFSAQTDLDAAGFKPFDVLFIIMIKLAEEMAKPVEQGVTGLELPPELVREVHSWFDTEKRTVTRNADANIGANAGLKPSPVSWAALLGLFAELKGEIKYMLDRKQEITEYRFNTIASLIKLLNRVLDESNLLLLKHCGREWLVIGEDFDKPGIAPPQAESLFLNYSNIFNELRAHLVFNVPIALVYSEKAAQLSFRPICIPDTPVFHPDHTPHVEGREALRVILEARIKLELFEDGQLTRVIVASGGNLRDLFELVAAAADNAALRPGTNGKISEVDATGAINEKRTEYIRRLGTSPFDAQPLTYEQKAERMVNIYHQAPGSDDANAILHSLLRARAVQEFNGKRWFGVHPLVVDYLKAQGKLQSQIGGPVLGGTD